MLLTITLADNVENLTLTEAGGAIDGTGNDVRNVLTGNSFANTLAGGAERDQIVGNTGDGADLMTEENVSIPIHQLTGYPLWERTFGYKSTEIVRMKPAKTPGGARKEDLLDISCRANLGEGHRYARRCEGSRR